MSSNGKLIINCGASHISAAVFSGQSGSLVLEQFAVQELEYDFSIDNDWLNTLAFAVSDLLARNKMGGDVSLIAPGYQLLTKPIKVPHVEEDKRAQIIAFEAQQNIPYPLHEVVWDSQVIADDGVETEVILIAAKAEIVNQLCGHMGSQGLIPQTVQAAPTLDYNAYRNAYPGDQEDALLVNVGARSTNLLFINETGFFVRNIALAGNTLTQSLADNLGKTFRQAESIKVAYFTGETTYESSHPSAQTLETEGQSFQKKLNQEITRSIVNFRRQHGAKAPTRILLTGRGALLPKLADRLSDVQNVPVEYFNPLSGVSFGSSVDRGFVEDNIHNLSEVLGEACRPQLEGAVSINLLPAALADRLTFQRKKPFIVAGVALLAMSTLPPIIYFQGIGVAHTQQAAVLEQRIEPLEKYQGKISEQQDNVKALRKQVNNLESLVDSKSNWPIFLSDLQERLQEVQDVWLDELKLEGSTDKRLQLSGRLLVKDYDPQNSTASAERSYARVDALLSRFTESKFISKVTGQRFNPENPRILEFDFTLVQNPDNPL